MNTYGRKKRIIVKNISVDNVYRAIKLMYMGEVKVKPEDSEIFVQLLMKLQINYHLQSSLNSTMHDSGHEGNPMVDLNENDTFPTLSPIYRSSVARVKTIKYRKKIYPRRKGRSLVSYGFYRCRFCPDMEFIFRRARFNHELTCSFNENSRSYHTCDHCGKSYLYKSNLVKHVISHIEVSE